MDDGSGVLGGILIGGASTRMGRPKHALKVGGVRMLDRAAAALQPHVRGVVLLGDADLPLEWQKTRRLADPPDANGPMAGILAAMRWAPRATWIIAACDLARVHHCAVEWLLEQRGPGCWAILPRATERGVEPLLALYEPAAAPLLEDLLAGGNLAPRHITSHPAVRCPRPPEHLADAWLNVNTPEDLQALGNASSHDRIDTGG